jgi:hypothetical protein
MPHPRFCLYPFILTTPIRAFCHVLSYPSVLHLCPQSTAECHYSHWPPSPITCHIIPVYNALFLQIVTLLQLSWRWGSKLLCNIDTSMLFYTVLYLRRLESSSAQLWEVKLSHSCVFTFPCISALRSPLVHCNWIALYWSSCQFFAI